MGEWSKEIGEVGERIVGELLVEIGWGDNRAKLDIACTAPERHAAKGSERRQSHGVDFIFSYKSPFSDGLLDNIVISSKYSVEPYPDKPRGKFREYALDLTASLDCFGRSEERRQQLAVAPRSRRARDIGVLFWLNNQTPEADVVSAIATAMLPTEDNFEALHVVDNKRASFLYDAIKFAKAEAPVGSTVRFAYVESGQVLNPAEHTPSGLVLPIEYLNLGLLPVRTEDPQTGATRLMMFLMDGFNAEGLGRLIGFSQSLAQHWAAAIDICFPDYNALNHSDDVNRMKNAFVDKSITAKLEVRSYRPDFNTQ